MFVNFLHHCIGAPTRDAAKSILTECWIACGAFENVAGHVDDLVKRAFQSFFKSRSVWRSSSLESKMNKLLLLFQKEMDFENGKVVEIFKKILSTDLTPKAILTFTQGIGRFDLRNSIANQVRVCIAMFYMCFHLTNVNNS
jgi:hypothetical protein